MTTNNIQVVTIVVPIYKVEKYLRRCLDSILGQTYENLEIILVDDGSPDNCPKICDQYAKKDKRVKVIHKRNGGLSDARNAGLEKTTGEWISFVDSDDWVEKNFIETLLGLANKNEADIAICSYAKIYPHDSIETISSGENSKLMNSLEALEDLFTYQKYGGVTTWNKLYKTDIFRKNSVKFPKGKIHEDNFTTYKTYLYASKIVYTDKALYNYLQRKNSIMLEGFSEKRLHAIEAAKGAQKFIQQRQPSIVDAVNFNLMMSRFTLLLRMHSANATKEFKTIWLSTIHDLKNSRPSMLKNKFLRRRDRLRLYISSLPKLYKLIDLAYVKIRKMKEGTK